MKFVAATRKELGVRTIFNILGPLTNPSKPSKMVVGVFKRELGPIMAQALKLVGVKKAWVVCGLVGLDEISPEGKTMVWDLNQDGSIKEFLVSPADFGLSENSLASVKGGDSAYNASIMESLLNGELPMNDPILDFVLMNSAALLFVVGKTSTLIEGVTLARESIASGNARKELEAFRSGLLQ